MKVSIIGAGYVGLISAVGWGVLGHEITCIDVDEGKVGKINNGIPPIFEEGLEENLKKLINEKKLVATTSFSSIKNSDVVFIAVGTPSAQDGSLDTRYIKAASEAIARELSASKRFIVIVVRSTVLPGTTEGILGATIERETGKKISKDFGLAMIPEFLREGSALNDFTTPDRIVIGVSDEKSKRLLDTLHTFTCPKQFTDIRTAEMIKYASNSFLAMKVSFANEMATVCERLSIDVDEVMKGVGMDSRIGPHFLVAGAGFGGSCFPKDVKALIHKAKDLDIEPLMLEATMERNSTQQVKLVAMLRQKMDLRGKTIGVLGLAFKAGTDDVRESSAIPTLKELTDAGAKVKAYDPKAMGNMKSLFPQIIYVNSWAECIEGCDAVLLISSWPEFMKKAEEYKAKLHEAPFFDARRILSKSEANKAGLEYYAIGRG